MGVTEWTGTHGSATDDRAHSVAQTAAGGYIVSGYTSARNSGQPDVYLLRTNSMGDSLWATIFGGAGEDKEFSVQPTVPDGGYVVCGVPETESIGSGDYDVWVIKADCSGRLEWDLLIGGLDRNFGAGAVQTTDEGYALVDGERQAGTHAVQWDGTNQMGTSVASGVYVVRLEKGGFEETQKIMLVK